MNPAPASTQPEPSGTPAGPVTASRRWWRTDAAWAVVLVCAVALAYAPLRYAGFVWDDDLVLTHNPLIKASDGLFRIWCTTDAADYWPVTYTSFWLEWRLWGSNALGYHATNLVLHVAEVLLIWAVLARLRIPGARVAALLFAVHPVNVETVAWIAQRKNLAAMFFALLSVLAFIRADLEAPPSTRHLYRPGARRWYVLSFAAFVAAVLGKGSVVVLPAILLLLIAWRRPLAWTDLMRLSPFGAAAVFLAAVNVWFQFHGSGEVVRDDGLFARLLGAAAAYWFYLGKALAPVGLSFVYPRWDIDPLDWRWWVPSIVLVLAAAAVWRRRRRVARGPLFAGLYFGFALLPVLGFADIYFMRYSLVADHYQHLALIGVVALAGAGWQRWYAQSSRIASTLAVTISALVVGFLVHATYGETLLYRDSDALWAATLERNPRCWLALTILGNRAADKGDHATALRLHERALRLRPDAFEVHYNLGNALSELGRHAEAIGHYRTTLWLRPRDAAAHYGLARALHTMGRRGDAIVEYRRALVHDPRLVKALNNLGIALAETGQASAAVAQFEAALRLAPGSAETHYNLGRTLHAEGDLARAIPHYRSALQARADYFEARNNLALALADGGWLAEAIEQYRQALRLRPTDARLHNAVGFALLRTGDLSGATAEFSEAARIDPNDAEAAASQGLAAAAAGRHGEAVAHYERALRLQPNSAEIRCNLADSLLKLNRVAEATSQLERAVQIDPRLAEAHYNLAVILRALGRRREATEHYQQARQLRPDLPAW